MFSCLKCTKTDSIFQFLIKFSLKNVYSYLTRATLSRYTPFINFGAEMQALYIDVAENCPHERVFKEFTSNNMN